MKKVVIIIATIFLIVIGANYLMNKDDNYYDSIADLVLSFYRTSTYDKSLFKDSDIDAIETYLSKLTHKNEVIDLSEYIEKSPAYQTDSPNSNGVYTKDGKCYIEYEDLDFDKPVEEVNYDMEPFKKVVCNNYFTDLYESQFYPAYEVTKKDPKYDYTFKNVEQTDTGYSYNYVSTYDGSGLVIKLVISDKILVKIETEYVYNSEV
ncbi:MAG: hypothetical protein IJO63_03840 [Bacilli bacterium]|nr:hypothetical protein [Bacilli bacterium]